MVTIYGLVCPTTREIRYIGKTRVSAKKRLIAHLQESKKRHSHKQRWLAGCLGAGLRPSIWVLEEVPQGVCWQDRERAWIKKALDIGLDLTNQTAGGEGLDWLSPEDKARYCEKLSASVRAGQARNPDGVAATRRACIRSWNENKAARIAALRAGWTEESYAKHRVTMAVLQQTPEFKAAKAAGIKASWGKHRPMFLAAFADPECKAKQSDSKKKAWRDPEKRARLMNRWTPEARTKQAELAVSPDRLTKIKAAMTPEVRAKQGAKMKEYWARLSPEERSAIAAKGLANRTPEGKAKHRVMMKERWSRYREQKCLKQQLS